MMPARHDHAAIEARTGLAGDRDVPQLVIAHGYALDTSADLDVAGKPLVEPFQATLDAQVLLPWQADVEARRRELAELQDA